MQRRRFLSLAALSMTGAPLGGPAGCARTPSAGTTGLAPGGRGSFELELPRRVGEGTLTVHFAIPERQASDAPILMVLPGRQRNAGEYLRDWLDLVDSAPMVVLSPEFPSDRFPTAAYNLGGTLENDDEFTDPRSWTFVVIEELFDHVVRALDGNQAGYNMFGHSAGAQFIHRMVLLQENARILTAVIANAGWYTLPESGTDYPYGLGGTPTTKKQLRHGLETRLVVLLGSDDTDTNAESLRNTPEAEAQGDHRLERGQVFYEAGRRLAKRHGAAFAWHLLVVPGVAHEHSPMARAARLFLA